MTYNPYTNNTISALGNYFNQIQNSLPVGSYTGFGSGADNTGLRQLIFTAGNGQNAIGSTTAAAGLGLINLNGQVSTGPYAGSTISSPILTLPGAPSISTTRPPTAAPTMGTTPTIQSSGTANDSLSSSFQSALTQAQSFIGKHPTVLLAALGIGALLIFGAVKSK